MMYESRRHIRNWPFLWLLPLILLDFVIYRDNQRTIIFLIVYLILLTAWIRVDNFYYFTNEVFIAKGFLRFNKIPLKDIKKIEIRKNRFLSKNTLLNRYQITSTKGKILVAPIDMDGFLVTFIEKTGISLS